MPIGLAVFLFVVGLAGTFFSFQVVSKRKKSKKIIRTAVTIGIAFCLIAALSVFYLAAALLLFGNIN